jgi:hypothetical protein
VGADRTPAAQRSALTRVAGMTFSIVGRSPDGSAMGVAVASKFLAAGA